MASSSSSLRRNDLLELSGLRNDGRKAKELRRLNIQMGCCFQGMSGSCLLEMGLTSVLATVRGPLECQRRSDELSDRAILEVTVKTAPFASMGGDRRVVSNATTDRRLLEQSIQLQRAMEAAIQLHLFPKSKFEISVWILQDDGSRLMAAMNATTLALVDAGIPIHDLVCACSAGLSNSGDDSSTTPLVDLNRKEESSFGGQPAVVVPCAMMPSRDTVVLAQCEARLGSTKVLEHVLGAARMACKTVVLDAMQAAIREHATGILKARSGQYTVVQNEMIMMTKQSEQEQEEEFMSIS